MAFKIDSSPISVIGAGAAGTVFTRALKLAGLHVLQVLSRNPDSARVLAEVVGATHASHRLSDLRAGPKLVVLAVPDDQIGTVAETLADASPTWQDSIAMHVSGALPSTVLSPLRHRGAEIVSFHPMLSLHADSPPEILAGSWINIEGTPAAVDVGRQLAQRLGAKPFVVDADTKAAIHLAASVSSNFLVTLMSAASDVLEACGLSSEDRNALLRPLVAGTLENIDFGDPGTALTGPISRGDGVTLEAQFAHLARLRPEYVAIFAGLAAETVRIAVRSGKIDDIAAAGMLDQILRHVDRNP